MIIIRFNSGLRQSIASTNWTNLIMLIAPKKNDIRNPYRSNICQVQISL